MSVKMGGIEGFWAVSVCKSNNLSCILLKNKRYGKEIRKAIERGHGKAHRRVLFSSNE